LLQLDSLIEREMVLVGWPRVDKWPVAFQPVRQMPDPQSVGGGLIVAEDGAEIVEDEEGRAGGSGWSVKPGLVAGTREGVAPDPLDPDLLPIAEAPERPLADLLRIEALGQRHLVAPSLTSLPICMLEIACGRRERVGHVVPNVALAIPVIVDGKALIGGGDELRVAHGAGPGAVHLLDRDIAPLHDLERRDQLLAGEARLGVVISERRQR